MPENGNHFAERWATEEASLARQRRAMERRATEQLAGGGALYSGQRQKVMGQVEQDWMEEWRRRRVEQLNAEEAARQAQLGREHEWGMQEARFGQETSMAGLRDQFQTKYLNMGYTHEQAMQAADAELAKYMQQAGHGFAMEEMGAQYGYQGQLQAQAEAAQRQLASDEAYYRSYLQDQVTAGQMDMQTAQNMYNQWSQQAQQQYGYAMQRSEQQYGYGMQGAQNQWDTYRDTLGYQHAAGMAGMGIEADWNTLMAQQQFQLGMAEYGVDMQQREWQWQRFYQQMGLNGQYAIQQMSQDTDDWLSMLMGIGEGVGYGLGVWG